jgi:WhiB family redox-sensing transcriptional regulator
MGKDGRYVCPECDYVAPPWVQDAKCRGMDNRIFFLERGVALEPIQRAREICDTCRVKNPCLEYGVQHSPLFGIFGGTTAKERRRLRGWT